MAIRVHVHANCQAVLLSGMLNEVYPDWKISYYEAHTGLILDELANYHGCVRTADIILSQPIHAGFRNRDDLSVDWVKANARPDAQVLVFPSMHFSAHQPTWELAPRPGFDLLAAHLLAIGLSPKAVLDRMMSPDLLTDADVEREIDASIAEAQRREIEDKIDILYTPFLKDNGYSRLLCHFSNHPLRETTAWVVNACLERLGYTGRVAVEGFDYQGGEHIAPLPAVTRYLNARSGMLDPELYATVRLHGRGLIPVSQYYAEIIDSLKATESEALFADVARRWPTIQVMRRLAANRSAIPGIERWAAG